MATTDPHEAFTEALTDPVLAARVHAGDATAIRVAVQTARALIRPDAAARHVTAELLLDYLGYSGAQETVETTEITCPHCGTITMWLILGDGVMGRTLYERIRDHMAQHSEAPQ